jgi:hydrogenase-4 component E
MNVILEFLIIGIIFLNYYLLSTSSIKNLIKYAAYEGVIAAILPSFFDFHPSALAFMLALIFLKGFIFPWLLIKIIEKYNIKYESKSKLITPIFTSFLFLSVLFLSFWLSYKLNLNSENFHLLIPASFITIFTGILIIIIKTKTISQIVGYIVLENGIYCFGVSVLVKEPFTVEAAILLDIFVALFVMGMAVFHIGKEFNELEIDSMSELKDVIEQKEDQL